MNYGALKTLMLSLQSAPSLLGTSVVFGEENINSEGYALPMVVIVPQGGPWQVNGFGYVKDVNVANEMIWSTLESIDLYIWSAVSPDADTSEVDNADAVEDMRARVLHALQYQRPTGLFYKPINGRWETFNNASNRFGRAYVLTVAVEICVVAPMYPEATVREVSLDPITIETGE